jgi:hypothetical protein
MIGDTNAWCLVITWLTATGLDNAAAMAAAWWL